MNMQPSNDNAIGLNVECIDRMADEFRTRQEANRLAYLARKDAADTAQLCAFIDAIEGRR